MELIVFIHGCISGSEYHSVIWLFLLASSMIVELIFLIFTGSAYMLKRRKRALIFLYINTLMQSYAASGILAILDLYMSNFLLHSDSSANAITAAFVVVMSAVGPLGGYFSDHVIGNYRTQVWCQTIWVIGQVWHVLLLCHYLYAVIIVIVVTTQVLVLVMTLSFVDSWLGGVTSMSVRLFVTAGLLILAFGQGLIQPVQPVIIAGELHALVDNVL